jgi:hypothetical protein
MVAWMRVGDRDPALADGWPQHRLQYLVRRIRAVGRRTPLHPAVIAQLLDPVATTDLDTRIRRLFAGPAPGRRMSALSQSYAATATRVLAAIGPQPAAVVQQAVERAHRSRERAPTLMAVIECVLLAGGRYVHDGATPEGSVLVAPPGSSAGPHDLQLVARVDGEVIYSRRELAELLTGAGISTSSAFTNTIARNPLILRVARNRYRVLTPL